MDTREDRIDQPERGRAAERPGEITKLGFRDVALRVKEQLGQNSYGLIAAGVAFFAFLAIFPALAAFISLYGLVSDPAQVEEQLAELGRALPQGTFELISEQLKRLSTASGGALTFGAVVGFLLLLWSAQKGISGLMQALNIVYREEEQRNWFKFNATALGLTLGALLFGVLCLLLVVLLPAVLGHVTAWLGEFGKELIRWVRWPVLAAFIGVGLAVMYHYGPSRRAPRWRWVSWGALLATILWLIISFGFSYYVGRFGDYNKTYGSVGAIAILLLWLQLSAYAVLIGALINAEMEFQTARDSTEGEPKPMGQRGATAADELGRVP